MSFAAGLLGFGALGSVFVLREWLGDRGNAKGPTEPKSSDGGRTPITDPIWVPTDDEGRAKVLVALCSCAKEVVGLSDANVVELVDNIQRCAWANLWPSVPFAIPAIAADHASVREAASLLESYILDAIEYCYDDGSGGGGGGGEASPGELMAKLLSQVPIGGRIYQVSNKLDSQGGYELAGRALYNSAYAAAIERGDDPMAAQQIAATVSADGGNKIQYWREIQCSPWNDALYGTFRYGGGSAATPAGTAIQLTPQHYRVYDALAGGNRPKRSIKRGEKGQGGDGPSFGAGSTLELLWLPKLRSDALLDLNRQSNVVTSGLQWPGGGNKTTRNPPPWITNLGIIDAPPAPWGCSA